MKTIDQKPVNKIAVNERSNPLKRDPTRTTMLRRRFETDMRKRLRKLKRAIRTIVVDADVFRLSKPKDPFTMNAPFRFENYGTDGAVFDQILGTGVDPDFIADTAGILGAQTPSAQLTAYQQWFKEQVDAGLLQVDDLTDTPWTSEYVQSSYKQSIVRTYNDVHGTGGQPFELGSRATFLEQAFGGPTATRQIQLLATRAFQQLVGVTAAMEQQMARVLADGLAHGLGARQIASRLNQTVTEIGKKRALVIARTEIIHSYAEGQLDAYEQLNLDGVKVMAEWSTAGDDRVCAACNALEGVVLKVQEARGIIPRHPNCRCAFVPANVGKPRGGQKKSKEEINKAINDSVRKQAPKNATLKEARDRSTWRGARRKIAKTRQPIIKTPFDKPSIVPPPTPPVIPKVKPPVPPPTPKPSTASRLFHQGIPDPEGAIKYKLDKDWFDETTWLKPDSDDVISLHAEINKGQSFDDWVRQMDDQGGVFTLEFDNKRIRRWGKDDVDTIEFYVKTDDLVDYANPKWKALIDDWAETVQDMAMFGDGGVVPSLAGDLQLGTHEMNSFQSWLKMNHPDIKPDAFLVNRQGKTIVKHLDRDKLMVKGRFDLDGVGEGHILEMPPKPKPFVAEIKPVDDIGDFVNFEAGQTVEAPFGINVGNADASDDFVRRMWNEIGQEGIIDEKHALRIGQMVDDEIMATNEKLRNMRLSLMEDAEKLRIDIVNGATHVEHEIFHKEFLERSKEYADLYAEQVIAKVSRVRDVGGNVGNIEMGSASEAKLKLVGNSIKRAQSEFPTDWNDLLTEYNYLDVGKIKRGHVARYKDTERNRRSLLPQVEDSIHRHRSNLAPFTEYDTPRQTIVSPAKSRYSRKGDYPVETKKTVSEFRTSGSSSDNWRGGGRQHSKVKTKVYDSTTTHELGHVFEYSTGTRLTDLETRFLRRRWQKTKNKKLGRVDGAGQIDDDFIQGYSGKMYNHRKVNLGNKTIDPEGFVDNFFDAHLLEGTLDSQNLEIFTMGLESVIHGTDRLVLLDTEYSNFIIGLMMGF
jgi:SPP1 gp7 family putative phage head morphogenesis protein